jgi:hypothetical protein
VKRRRLHRLRTPSDYMAKYGVHPHDSHEIDVVKIVTDLATRAERARAEVERSFDADKTTDWKAYARQLATRLRNQRGEIKRLHEDLERVRAEAHRWRELVERAGRAA